MQFWRREELGSLSLEAAVTLPAVLLYLVLLFTYILSVRAEMIWQEATWTAIQETSLGMSLLQNEAYEKTYEESLQNLELSDFVRNFLTDFAGSKTLELRQKYWFKQNTNHSKLMISLIKNPQGYIVRDSDSKNLYYDYSYQLPFSRVSEGKSFRLPLPYWGGYDGENAKIETAIKEEIENTNNEIWLEHGFTRGTYFRSVEGANLPESYPVIAKFENGIATSIKSVDLTAPTYAEAESIRSQIGEHAEKLLTYKGTNNWGESGVTISSAEIQSRVLHLVIPENTSKEAKAVLEAEKLYWDSNGILVEWVERGISSKYLHEE